MQKKLIPQSNIKNRGIKRHFFVHNCSQPSLSKQIFDSWRGTTTNTSDVTDFSNIDILIFYNAEEYIIF